jgi:hypothetical protein
MAVFRDVDRRGAKADRAGADGDKEEQRHGSSPWFVSAGRHRSATPVTEKREAYDAGCTSDWGDVVALRQEDRATMRALPDYAAEFLLFNLAGASYSL